MSSSSPHDAVPPPDPSVLRRSYEADGFEAEQLAPTWVEQFARWFADAVAATTTDTSAPGTSAPGGLTEANAAVLATASGRGAPPPPPPGGPPPGGGGPPPPPRTVLIKAFDHRGLVLYTNYTSRKGQESAENPYGSLVLPWHAMGRQVVVVGSIERVSRAETERYFAARPRGSQLGAWASHQSETITSRTILDERAAHLAARWPPGTPVPTPPFWGGLRLVPETVEFWQGRSNRLHDRLRFRRITTDRADATGTAATDPLAGGAERWIVERLAP
ncbi:pyridoxamine 5'-phosphate oxidase [Frankia sp. AgPm24]|uniref:pyridoxamine 5'-phosphate oxidase n=1 Tax=Frankia sp. AgPm24 TaxID=631128 RepID=UPI00200F327F|nr:pyridoxamine 5'-phosphate oxidase [Frankia sp. AgPm24]MCK9921653.1 pyridoxamine 5'-phosphate oxidase [Frankia sp. AgPm24]